MQFDHVVEWLTAKGTDDADATRPYSTTGNNSFDIDVINHSTVYTWEGPSNGTPIASAMRDASSLLTSTAAIDRGALWTNAAGNFAQRTWFARTPSFNAQTYLDVAPAGSNDCNTVTIEENTPYLFQARWNGTWGAEDKDINLFLQGPLGITGQAPAFMHQSMTAQDGSAGDNPYELLEVNLPSIPQPPVTPPAMPATQADYCLWVSNTDPTETLDWIQVQMFLGEGNFTYRTPNGSINTPADSNNDGFISVGATDNSNPPAVKDFSARGPVPEPHPNGRTEPDLVAPNTTIDGTSFSSPRIAAIAALAVQALGHDARYDQPHEIAQYLKSKASHHANPDNDRGHGLTTLPAPDPPTNVTVQQVSIETKLALAFDHSPWDAAKIDRSNINYRYRIVKAIPNLPDGAEVASGTIAGSHSSPTLEVPNLEYNAQYSAFVKTCPGTGDQLCGPEASTTDTLTIETIGTPQNLRYTLNPHYIKLTWDPVAHASYYVIVDPTNSQRLIALAETQYTQIIDRIYGTTVNYAVRASTGSVESEDSNHVQITVPAVDPPTNLTFTQVTESPNTANTTFEHSDWPYRIEAGDSVQYEVRVTAQNGIHAWTNFHPPQRFDHDAEPFNRSFPVSMGYSYYYARARTCLTLIDHCAQYSAPTTPFIPQIPDGHLIFPDIQSVTDADTTIIRWTPTDQATSYDVGTYDVNTQAFTVIGNLNNINQHHATFPKDDLYTSGDLVLAVRVNTDDGKLAPVQVWGNHRSLYDPQWRLLQRKNLDDIQTVWLNAHFPNEPAHIDFGSHIAIHWIWDQASAFHEIQQWDGVAGIWKTLKFRDTSDSNAHIEWETLNSALIAGVPDARPYSLRLRGIFQDNVDDWTPTLTIPAADGAQSSNAPRPPTLPQVASLQVSTDGHDTSSATMSWDPSEGAISYEIDFGDVDSRLTATQTSATVTNLTSNTEYTFRVRARNGVETSRWSDPVTINTYPTAPTGLQATPRS